MLGRVLTFLDGSWQDSVGPVCSSFIRKMLDIHFLSAVAKPAFPRCFIVISLAKCVSSLRSSMFLREIENYACFFSWWEDFVLLWVGSPLLFRPFALSPTSVAMAVQEAEIRIRTQFTVGFGLMQNGAALVTQVHAEPQIGSSARASPFIQAQPGDLKSQRRG